MNDIYDVIVVGGGLAGLAAARLTQRAGATTLVLDGHAIGGRARSDTQDGFIFNRGPHALYLGGPAERVLTDLGLPLAGGPPGTAYAARGDRLAPLPAGARSLLTTTLLGARGKVAVGKLLARFDKLDARRWADVSVAAWLADLDLPTDAEDLVRLLVRVSTYAEAPTVLSAEVAIGQIQAVLRHGVRYLDGGWQSLVDGLAAGLTIEPGEVVQVAGDGTTVVVATADGTTRVARNVIVAAGAPAVAARLLDRAPFTVGPAAEAACLDLGVRHPSSPSALFGLDEPLYLSTHCPPARLAPEGMAVVAVARYLRAGDASPADRQRAELQAHARRAGIAGDAVVAARYLHRMTVVSAIATAELGGLAGRPSATDAGVDGVLLAGDWVGPVGHLADASLASAAEAARLAPRESAGMNEPGQPGQLGVAPGGSGDHDAFLEQRERLWGLAYRMLGSRADADDVVQDAWLRWQRSDRSAIERPAAWLTTVTSRLAIDRLRARRVESERYVGPWLPEPISLPAVDDPSDLADSITVGFLALLERLDPVERVVFLLADVFREPFADIAVAVGRSEAACRQLASRARRRVHDPDRHRGRTVSRAEQDQLVRAFSLAAAVGDLGALTNLLAPDVVLLSDGGADHHAARRPVVGPERVARFVTNLTKRMPPQVGLRSEAVNGEPGLVFLQDGRVVFVLVLHITDRGIEDLFIVVNPDKLHALSAAAAPEATSP